MPPKNQTPPAPAPPKVEPGISDLLEPGESMLMVVRRHPIGIILIYLEVLLGVGALAALLIFVAPGSFKDLSKESNRLLIAGVVLAIGVLIFVLFVATYVYRQCRLIITNKSLVEVFQRSLFSRNISRLSMSNVEDVTSEQKGILATIFGFGTLVVQTAGEMDNFIFPTCPNPNAIAHEILEARQAYAQSIEEGNERLVTR